MSFLRAIWHPFVPPLLVVLVLPLATLAVPAEQRPGWLFLLFLVGGPAAAVASVFALRAALRRIPIAAEAPEPTYQEKVLSRSLRWLLVLVSVVGPLTIAAAASSLAAEALHPHQAIFMSLIPLFFTVFGWRLWRDLTSTRRRRALGLAPLPFERSTWTGDARLDALLGRRPKVTARFVWIIGFVSALAYLSPGHALLAQLAKLNEPIQRGELWRFATASFVHADLVGLAVSAMAFFAVAPLVEVLIGPRWLVFQLIVGGIAAVGASFAFAPAHPYMGTTGAVAALTGMLLFFTVRQRLRMPPATVRRVALYGLAAVAILAFAGVLLPAADSAAHLGGLFFGSVVGLLVDPSPSARAAMEKARQEAVAQAS